MCGRYFIDIDDENLKAWMTDDVLSFTNGEVYPTDQALVLIYQDKVKPAVLPWGFIKWDSKSKIINARSETVMTSTFFKDAYANQKAIVLASGFYEWGASKIRHIITPKEHSLIYMAALIQHDDQGFAIITQPATHPINTIHDRQPVLIHKDQITEYLTHQLSPSLVTYPSVSLDMIASHHQTSLF